MDEWVRAAYRKKCCDKYGQRLGNVDLYALRDDLMKQRLQKRDEITIAIHKLDLEICADICRDLEIDDLGDYKNLSEVHVKILHARTDLQDRPVRKKLVNQLQEYNKALLNLPDDELRSWIHERYLARAFIGAEFIGWRKFSKLLVSEDPHRIIEIKDTLAELRKPGHTLSLQDPSLVQKFKAAQRKLETKAVSSKAVEQVKPNLGGAMQDSIDAQPRPPPLQKLPSSSDLASSVSMSVENVPTNAKKLRKKQAADVTMTKLAAQHLKILQLSDQSREYSEVDSRSDYSSDTGGLPIKGADITSHDHLLDDSFERDFMLMDNLMSQNSKDLGNDSTTSGVRRDIGHAPLLSGNMVIQHAKDLVPQYGFIGCHADDDTTGPESRIFQNTNVPFSSFVCGVQGSGKSHTTATMLENALIPSKHLGRLKAPASALVFSYGDWSSGGTGFDISEATYLARSDSHYPGTHVKRVTVLVSPSNPAIKALYEGPNIKIVPFRLNAKALDISALRTLMAVDDKSTVPLYMAKVESILRDIASKSKDGSLDYKVFKVRLAMENFDPTQKNMLEMRLNLLESFLDLTGKAVGPVYRPGEITILDLSDPFVSPSTACILFKLGLERFLQSSREVAKLVVLDEAHKYMLDTPGSRFLTDCLAKTIRLQRHQGARVIISTQEPTVSTDLIALCSVTVIHRFTSPTWYAALKRHISAMGDDDKATMRQIEGLETGEALVYAPNAVLGRNDDDSLIKATGRLLKLNIRKRVTYDGGESIMAV